MSRNNMPSSTRNEAVVVTHNNKRNQHHNNHYPSSFICPLSMEIMDDPVMDLCSHNFDRIAIIQYLENNNGNNNTCCPISRKPLCINDLIRNDTLAERIDKWKWYNQYGNNDNNDFIDIEKNHNTNNSKTITNHNTIIMTECNAAIEEDDDDDMIMNKQGIELSSSNKIKRNKNNDKRIEYTAIPVDFMLLPQEREIMKRRNIEIKNELYQKQYKRKIKIIIFCIIITIIILIFVILSKNGVIKIY